MKYDPVTVMGNKFGSCGCRTESSGRGYGYSPYSKQMSRNLVRFWAEVFLLAQEGQSVETKWQMVVPKLVPVNVARVQDTPTVISHVTAYNTKVDKVMDTLIYHPGIEVYRGSECFIYWSDPQKGLTWGLNFITPEDASYFVNILCGGSSLMCRRANSTQSLEDKAIRPSKHRSTSSPGTPESSTAHTSRKHTSGRQQSVKFADAPVFCEPSPVSSDRSNGMGAVTPAEMDTVRTAEGVQMTPHDRLPCSPGRCTDNYVVHGTTSIHGPVGSVAGMVYERSEASDQVSHSPVKTGSVRVPHGRMEDHSGPAGSSFTTSSNESRFIDSPSIARQREREAIWKRLDSIAAATEALEPMRVSLDSTSLRKMIDPVQREDQKPNVVGTQGQRSIDPHSQGPRIIDPHSGNQQPRLFDPKGQQSTTDQPSDRSSITGDHSGSYRTRLPSRTAVPPDRSFNEPCDSCIKESKTPGSSKVPGPSIRDPRSGIEDGGPTFAGEDRPSMRNLEGPCDVVLRQNNREVPVVSTPSLKRSSIRLMAGKSGQLKSMPTASTSQIMEEAQKTERVCPTVNEDDNSLSSSLDESTTSHQSASGRETKGEGSAWSKIRKSGYLSMKQWIVSKDQSISILSNAMWQQYWCCVKGYALRFHLVVSIQEEATSTDASRLPRRSPLRLDQHGIEETKVSDDPSLVIDLLNCLAQAIPEYPRRQHVFCLSTGLGHVYLLQATYGHEVDGWIQALHTQAALASVRSQSRDAASRSLRKEIEKMEEKIETVAKLIKLSQLPTVGTVSLHQVGDWENELELLQLQLFMAKAYSAAMKGHEMPSCKKVLAAATSSTKGYLSRLSAFTLGAMHAYIFSKSAHRLTSPSATPRRDSIAAHAAAGGSVASTRLSTTASAQRGSDRDDPVIVHRHKSAEPEATISTSQLVQSSSSSSDIYSGIVDLTGLARSSTTPAVFKSRASLVQITLPSNQVTVVSVTDMDTVSSVVQKACDKAGLRSERCFMLLRKVTSPGESYVPDDMELLQPKIATHQVEIRERLVYHVHLYRTETPDRIFGLTIRAQKQLARNRLTVYVSNVDENGLAKRAGLIVGDEILMVNNQCVKTLNSQQVERLLQESQCLCLIMRTKRTALPICLELVNCDSSQESLRTGCSGSSGCSVKCPSGQKHLGLIDEDEEAENWFSDTCGLLQQRMENQKVKYRHGFRSSLNPRGRQRYSLPVIPTNAIFNQLLQRESTSANASPRHLEQRYSLAAGNLEKRISSSEPGGMSSGAVPPSLRPSGKLGPSEKLEKVLFELVETDRAYVEDLDTMMRTYLQPLRDRKLLPSEPLNRLIDASVSVIRFQRLFLEELQEAARLDSNVAVSYPAPCHLRSALLRVGGLFLNTAARFRLYSSFCAAYFRMQKILKSEDQNVQLQQFLAECNVHKQHSSTLESYLIKPVQRVLRYPLFLQQMKSLTSQGTPEHVQILEALTKMEKVAEYINEMQRIYEEYGTVFAQIQAQCQQYREKLSLELSDLLMFGEVGWLNAGDEAGRKKNSISNGPIDCICFVFKSAIVLLILDKGKGKKGKNNNNQNQEKTPVFRLIPVAEIEINGSDAGSTENHYIWILIHIDPILRAEKVYHFANRRKDIKHQFLRAIRKAGLLMSREHNGTNGGSGCAVQTRIPPIEKSTQECGNQKAISGGYISQVYGDDEDDLSSPDSGVPQIAAVIPNSFSSSWGPASSNGGAAPTATVALRANGVAGGRSESSGSGGTETYFRPLSFNSSQSDPGYGSNNETHKKDAIHFINNPPPSMVSKNGNNAVR